MNNALNMGNRLPEFAEFGKYSIYSRSERGISSVGRAFEWHSKGQEFDSPMLHSVKDLG